MRRGILPQFAVIGAVLLYLLAASSHSLGEEGDTRFELEEIVVTGTAVSDPIRSLPKNITVITSSDIEQAPSRNVVDLLARETNITLRSLFGHDKLSGVDLRGMGDTYGSNVVVMVDGFSINSPDMAGIDMSSIPLESIDRIEIVRGAGSVLYGDGAVGGVINIITKRGVKSSDLTFGGLYGSYSTRSADASYRKRDEGDDFVLDAGIYDSAGYRENGFLSRKDASVKVGYELSETSSLTFSISPHKDSYGLPGPVSKEDVDSREGRVLSDAPDDSGENTDIRMSAGFETFLGDAVSLQVNGGYRFRDNYYVMGYTPLLTREEQTDHIDEDTYSLKAMFSSEYELFERFQEIQSGIELALTEYIRTELSKSERKSSSIKSLGLFLMNRFHFIEDLTWQLGYRFSLYSGNHRVDAYKSTEEMWENGEPITRLWMNHSFDTGIVYDIGSAVSVFLDVATSFRTPNVDEFALSDSDLRPQQGAHLDTGVRVSIGDAAELSIAGFLIRITNEIYYGEDPVSGTPVNRNYEEPTNRIGVETDLKLYPLKTLYLWGNYTFMDARFEGQWTFVPLVPMHKMSFGVEWQIVKPVVLSVTATYVGSRFDGNDETNTLYDPLGPYTVVDAKLTYRADPLTLFIGVNNLFDELYSTAAYSEQYYPMPTSNYYGGVELRF
jgi:iron complex outermembrane receptor protein